MKKTLSSRTAEGRRAPGFTLVELIMVIAIITVLMTIGSFGLKNFTKASGVSVAVPIVESLIAQARALAMDKSTDARLLICADPDEAQKHLRFILLAYKYTDPVSGDEKWVANTRGSYLPDAAFFSRTFSHTNHSNDSGVIPAVLAADQSIYGAEDDTTANTNLSGPYFYYEFNSQGVVGFRDPDTSDFEASDAASFVIGAGIKPPGETNPTVSGAGGERNFGGAIIWKRGNTSTIKHPDQINLPANVTTF